jgi:hypothetical protein
MNRNLDALNRVDELSFRPRLKICGNKVERLIVVNIFYKAGQLLAAMEVPPIKGLRSMDVNFPHSKPTDLDSCKIDASKGKQCARTLTSPFS